MTSTTSSYLTSQRAFRISGEKLEMQLYKEAALYLKWCEVWPRKNTWRVEPPPQVWVRVKISTDNVIFLRCCICIIFLYEVSGVSTCPCIK